MVLTDPFSTVAQFHDTYTSWLRLEPRSRSNDIGPGLEARIADPLWALMRQWQMGEFQAEDAGHPIDVEVVYSPYSIRAIIMPQENSQPRQAIADRPLEVLVEREREPMNYRLRVQIGQQFERLLRTRLSERRENREIKTSAIAFYRDAIGFELPSEQQLLTVDERTRRFVEFVAGRVVDGEKLLEADPLPVPDFENFDLEGIIEEVFAELLAWHRQLLSQPSEETPNAWDHAELHYRFGVGSGVEEASDDAVTLVASDYRNGELDWYTFALNDALPDGDAQKVNLFPTRLDIAGQAPRWWTFADKQFNLSRLETQVTDLAKLLYTRFVTYYSDDWFQASLAVNVGSLIQIKSVEATDVFGQKLELPPARAEGTSRLNRWEMFTLTQGEEPDGPGVANTLLIPPLAGYRAESEPLEEVRFIRDEDANMVWAIERVVRNCLGQPVQGFEAQRARWMQEIRHRLEQLMAAYEALPDSDRQQGTAGAAEMAQEIASLEALLSPHPNAETTAKYRLSTTVPRNWIPFLPYNTGEFSDRRNGSIALVRAKMWRDIDAEEEQDVDAMTSLLQFTDESRLMWLEEETVLRAGVRVLLTKQRVRWTDGSTHVWLGRKVLSGRGEGSSGLKFDYIE